MKIDKEELIQAVGDLAEGEYADLPASSIVLRRDRVVTVLRKNGVVYRVVVGHKPTPHTDATPRPRSTV